jgi:hypothetical protein
MTSNIEIEFVRAESGLVPVLKTSGVPLLSGSNPITLHLLGQEPRSYAYESVTGRDGRFEATARCAGGDGTVLDVTDIWRLVDGTTAEVERTGVVASSGASAGVRLQFEMTTCFGGHGGSDDFQYFIPGSLYNRNDTDHDGVEDYLHTYIQDYRDDRLASLAVLAFSPAAGKWAALTRPTTPAFDTAIPDADLLKRHFVQRTDIGSLGLRPGPDDQASFRASYPFAEEYSYALNLNRDGWAAYAPNEAGAALSISYRLSAAPATSLTDAIAQVTEQQMRALGSEPRRPDFTLRESLDYRTALYQHFYREWNEAEDPREPAGYMVHFSPRTGQTQGTLLEYGFTGAQTLLAYDSIRYGREHDIPLYVLRAQRVVDFFVRHCQLENGFSQGIYDVAKRDFTYWFTGILLPFQYSDTKEVARGYVGRQVADALWPVAQELKQIPGNYMRTMCDSFSPVLMAYRLERDHGVEHEEWLTAAIRFGDFLLATQGDDGSWYRGYDTGGRGLTSPAAWFGASDTESKSGTIFPIPVLLQLHELTGNAAYLTAARRGADFIIATYVETVEYLGGLNDTTHIKSVKADGVGVMFAMRSLLKVYEATHDDRYLDAASDAAKVLASWVYLWDVPLPAGTLLADSGFKSTGWAVCDVIPGGSYLDLEFPEFIGDYVRIAELTRSKMLFEVAELVEFGTQHALSVPQNMHGYVMAGIQCEGIMTGYWVSDPDTTQFSGAVNKAKGDDNDTTNGLVNAQAIYGMYDLLDRYGSLDFDAIRKLVSLDKPDPAAAEGLRP